MADANEIIIVELTPENKMRLETQVYNFFNGEQFSDIKKDLGLEDGWPYDCDVTLAQLVLLAQKTGMKITISNIDFSPMKKE